jgi:deazaflavin-dependent oxidoreductase (nitroreductase family)
VAGLYDRVVAAILTRSTPVHVFLYRALHGRIVDRASSGFMPVLLLTTTGRHSGRSRTVALGHMSDGDDLVVIGSNGGLDAAPAWTANLRTRPEAAVQLADRTFAVRADFPEEAERERLWNLVASRYRFFHGYQKRTRRRLAVVRLSRAR